MKVQGTTGGPEGRLLVETRRRRTPVALIRAAVVIALALMTAGTTAAVRPCHGAETRTDKDDAENRRRIDALEKKIDELTRQLSEARASGGAVPSESLAELGRRLDVLAAELEKLRSGSAANEAPLSAGHGLGPAAAKIYGRDRGVSIGGYGEALYQNFSSRADEDSPSGLNDTVDLLRAVLYFGYKFDKGIVFNSEIEYEHASTGEGDEERGEVSVEFAYLDFPIGTSWGIRAGQMLVPVGMINELHEPPIFLGARRPDVETVIIPSTWSEVGVGGYGQSGSVEWRASVIAGLDAEGFEASGIREGRQSGSQSRAEGLGLTGRVDWTPRPGLLVGGSGFVGNSGQGLTDDSGRKIRARTTLYDLHADWKARGWQARAVYARGRIGDVARLNDVLGFTRMESIGRANHGWYAEAGYDVLGGREEGPSGASLVPFARYERYDSHDSVPDGFLRDPANRVHVRTCGVSYKPIPNVVIKADHQNYRNDAGTGVDRFNLALGYLF